MNQDKATHKSDPLLTTLRICVFSSVKWVGIVNFLYSLYTVTRFNSHSQSRRSIRGEQK